ncbi:diacylglycerol/lipid kinase family protein [Leucobacter sp. HY1908]
MSQPTHEAQHPPFALVVNPASALGRGSRVAARVSRALRDAGVSSITISAPNAAECGVLVERACAAGVRGLILVGGDGLISTVLQVAAARALPIGIVPAGSGNDFARQFDLPRSPTRAVRALLRATPQPVDLGLVQYTGQAGVRFERWFAGGLSIGIDAAVNRRANALRLPIGPLRYAAALLTEVALLRSRTFRVTGLARPGDGDPERPDHTYSGLLASVMNIRTFGGGIPISPESRVTDGALELIEVAHASKLRLFSVLGTLARGKHAALPEVRITRLTRVMIEAGSEIAFADGEEVGTGPFEVRVVPGAIRVLAPASS